MAGSWVSDELQGVDLRDKRLEKRMVSLLETLSKSSTASIPAGCDDRAEMVAAYRFFDNPKVEFGNVLAPHIEASYRRVAAQPVALLVQDTTELDLTRPGQQMDGAGPLHNGDRCGALLHLLHAFTPDGIPLGTVSAQAWTRETPPVPRGQRTAGDKRVACARKPIEQKESFRWLETARHCQEIQEHLPATQLILLADRESDISEVLAECSRQQTFDWIIRGGSDRVLKKESIDEASVRVKERLAQQTEQYRLTLRIRARRSWGSQTIKQRPGKADRDAREVTVSVHCGQVTLNDPRPRHEDGITVNAVLVHEPEPPEQEQPIEWLLLTSLPIETREHVAAVVAHYEQRWTIELLFKVLKSGCRIESRRFEHIDRFLPALGLYLIIAWRSFYICRISRTHAEQSCETVYTRAEWQSVWMVVTKKKPPKRPPELLEMTKLMAGLGGYVNRKNTGPPGPQSVWLGLQRMHDLATAWLTFGPGASTAGTSPYP